MNEGKVIHGTVAIFLLKSKIKRFAKDGTSAKPTNHLQHIFFCKITQRSGLLYVYKMFDHLLFLQGTSVDYDPSAERYFQRPIFPHQSAF